MRFYPDIPGILSGIAPGMVNVALTKSFGRDRLLRVAKLKPAACTQAKRKYLKAKAFFDI